MLHASPRRTERELGLHDGCRHRQSRDEKDEQKYTVMRLARLEQASFGTGIRRASHCATTPLRLYLDSWDGSLLGRYGTGVGLGALARAYKC